MNDQFFAIGIIQNELLPKCTCCAIDEKLGEGSVALVGMYSNMGLSFSSDMCSSLQH